jgi:hypothetical protein
MGVDAVLRVGGGSESVKFWRVDVLVIQSHRLQSLEPIFTCHIPTVHKRVTLDPLPTALPRKVTSESSLPSHSGKRGGEGKENRGREEGFTHLNLQCPASSSHSLSRKKERRGKENRAEARGGNGRREARKKRGGEFANLMAG